jgi:hypothetical protein
MVAVDHGLKMAGGEGSYESRFAEGEDNLPTMLVRVPVESLVGRDLKHLLGGRDLSCCHSQTDARLE